jgi:membrane-associated phospholipid phosphatase
MRGSERLTTAFLLALSATAAVARPPGHRWLPLAFGALAGATALLARVGPRAGRWRLARDLFPAVVILATFSLLQPAIVALVPWRLDAALAGFDDRWLGPLVASWRGLLGRPAPLTDAAYLLYLSFYFLPLAAALAARLRQGEEGYERALLAVLGTFYASWIGYFLFPAAGPRLPEALEGAVIGGGAISEASRAFLRAAEATTLDAFPSGHTAVSLVAAAVAPATSRCSRALWWGWAAGVVFATVYVHVHYASDVIAGGLLAAGALAVTSRLSASSAASPPPPTGRGAREG